MPNDAFYKLDTIKRNKILEAMKKEFGTNSFEKASINRIVEDAGISKGSFWCYFENKEEAINYIIENYIEHETEMMIKFIREKKGDVFEAYKELYVYLSYQDNNNYQEKLVPNIFKDLIINNEKITCKFPPDSFPKILFSNEEFREVINIDILKIFSQEELFSLIKLLNYIMRTNTMDRMLGKVSKEKAYENYLREIEFIKKGVYKENV